MSDKKDIPWMSGDEDAENKLHTYRVRIAYVTYVVGEVLASSREQAKELASRPIFIDMDDPIEGPPMVLSVRRTDEGIGESAQRSGAVMVANEMFEENGSSLERDAYIEGIISRGEIDETDNADLYWRAYLFVTGRDS